MLEDGVKEKLNAGQINSMMSLHGRSSKSNTV